MKGSPCLINVFDAPLPSFGLSTQSRFGSAHVPFLARTSGPIVLGWIGDRVAPPSALDGRYVSSVSETQLDTLCIQCIWKKGRYTGHSVSSGIYLSF